MAKGLRETEGNLRIIIINKPDALAARVVGAVAVDEGTTRVAGQDFHPKEVSAALAMVVSEKKDRVAELETDLNAQEILLKKLLTSGDVAERQVVFFEAVQEVRDQTVQRLSRGNAGY